MARYGYMLLDQHEPDVSRQALQLDGIGGFDRIFVERGSRTAPDQSPPRQQRNILLNMLQAQDVVYAAAADRLFDNLRDFTQVWSLISEKNAHLVMLEENIDSRGNAGRQAIKALQTFARLDFSYQSKRKKAGIKAAKESGRRIGRPPVAVPPHFRDICSEWAKGRLNGHQAAMKAGMKPTSFYKKASELGFRAPGRQKKNEGTPH